MKSTRLLGAALAASVLLAACGGGGDEGPRVPGPSGAPTTLGDFKSVVSFGDSVSDLGAYTPATQVPGTGTDPALNPARYVGGRFTTNGSSSKIWVELVAGSLGLAITPAEIGFNGQSLPCPAAAAGPAAAATCTGYGQGGARVTNPAGIGKKPDGSGALTVPMVTQVAKHLERKGGSFTANDLVLVFGGNNDMFVAFGTFAAKAAAYTAQATAGQITASKAQELTLAAQIEGDASVKQAGEELAALVRTQIVGKGAKYVAVLNALDTTVTPFGRSLPSDAARAVLSGFVKTFNTALKTGLDRQPVALIDADAQFRAVVDNPETYGLENVTIPTCDSTKISAITGGLVTDGSSLFCNADALPWNGMRAGSSATTWLFADGVHPSAGGHAIVATFINAELKRLGWKS